LAPFDRMLTSSFSSFVVTMAISVSFRRKSKLCRKSRFFHTPSTWQPTGENGCEYFRVFSQPSQLAAVLSGVNSFCKKSYVSSQLKRVTYDRRNRQTDRQTDWSMDSRKCDINSWALTLAKYGKTNRIAYISGCRERHWLKWCRGRRSTDVGLMTNNQN